MKTNIYYFSGTGNSLAVAKEIASELDGEISVSPVIKELNKRNSEIEADAIGIIFPVYCHDLPNIIKKFIQKMLFNGNPYIFAIATYNAEPGNALFNLDSMLQEKNLQLDAGFHISMPGNNVMIIDLTTSNEENERRFTAKNKKMKQIITSIDSKERTGVEGTFNPNETYEIKAYLDDIYHVAEHFWVTKDCKQCKTCKNVCPKNNIQYVEDKVIWGTDCEYCLACLHWCPEKAIQNGQNSAKCRRYHHPDISIKEIILQSN